MPKNCCFLTVVLEKTLESTLDTARRSNQSILKEINTEYSLRGLMLKLKFQHFAHLEIFSQAFARNCEVRRIAKAEARDFLTHNHSYGYAACRYHYGLFLKR